MHKRANRLFLVLSLIGWVFFAMFASTEGFVERGQSAQTIDSLISYYENALNPTVAKGGLGRIVQQVRVEGEGEIWSANDAVNLQTLKRIYRQDMEDRARERGITYERAIKRMGDAIFVWNHGSRKEKADLSAALAPNLLPVKPDRIKWELVTLVAVAPALYFALLHGLLFVARMTGRLCLWIWAGLRAAE